MSTLNLGMVAGDLNVYLTEGSDFIRNIRPKQPDGTLGWPTGTTLTIEFANGVTWTAEMVDGWARWNVDKADTTAAKVPHLTPAQWRYVNGTTDIVYFVGKAVRKDRAAGMGVAS